MKLSRPIGVTIVASLYILVGAGGFAAHFPELLKARSDSIAIELTELAALVTGVFLLRGQNWARWVACAWMAFHVAISFPAISQVAVHSAFLALICWALFRRDASVYFREWRRR
jgi:hypothetical protein